MSLTTHPAEPREPQARHQPSGIAARHEEKTRSRLRGLLPVGILAIAGLAAWRYFSPSPLAGVSQTSKAKRGSMIAVLEQRGLLPQQIPADASGAQDSLQEQDQAAAAELKEALEQTPEAELQASLVKRYAMYHGTPAVTYLAATRTAVLRGHEAAARSIAQRFFESVLQSQQEETALCASFTGLADVHSAIARTYAREHSFAESLSFQERAKQLYCEELREIARELMGFHGEFPEQWEELMNGCRQSLATAAAAEAGAYAEELVLLERKLRQCEEAVKELSDVRGAPISEEAVNLHTWGTDASRALAQILQNNTPQQQSGTEGFSSSRPPAARHALAPTHQFQKD